MTRRRVVLKGWRLYSVMLLLTYLLLFGWLWIKTKLLHGHWHSYMDFSLGEIAILAGILQSRQSFSHLNTFEFTADTFS